MLGDASGGLMDVNLNGDDAIQFTKDFLPDTAMIFGRESRKSSHRVYRLPDTRAEEWERKRKLCELWGEPEPVVQPDTEWLL